MHALTPEITRPGDDDEIQFAEEGDGLTPARDDPPWRVLIVDDDAEIHRVTRLVLQSVVYKGRRIEILSAYSGLEARTLLSANPDVSVILLDVVMETDDSGLRLVRFIREQYVNRKTRIILRTGQPGYAPELTVMLDYDINDYRAKSELTAERLLTAVVISFRAYMDIETAEQAAAQTRQAKEALIAKSTFFAHMSHELRTPLNAVVGNIDLLRLTPLTPRQIDIADSAARAAKMLMEVIGDVLDLSKIESDRFEIESTSTDFDDLFAEIRTVMAPAIEAKGLRLSLFRAPNVPRHVLTDRVRLRQVLVNLLANAIKFTAGGGVSATVRYLGQRAGADLLRFEVIDSGSGFPAGQAARLFQPFVQANDFISRKYGGNGLGLAICQRIVELFGGTIMCSSEPGRGSSFWFELPLVGLRASDSLPPNLSGRVVMLVGTGDRPSLEAFLIAHGASVIRAEDLSIARAIVERLPDRNELSGVVIADKILNQNDRLDGLPVPIVVMVNGTRTKTYDALHAGAVHTCADPEHRAELLAFLGPHLPQPR